MDRPHAIPQVRSHVAPLVEDNYRTLFNLVDFYNRGHPVSGYHPSYFNDDRNHYNLYLPNREGVLVPFSWFRPYVAQIIHWEGHGFEVNYNCDIFPRHSPGPRGLSSMVTEVNSALIWI